MRRVSELFDTLVNINYQTSHNGPSSKMASKSTASRSAATGSSSVRRNLFHHTLSRRPTSASTSTSATTQEGSQDEISDIVVKDRNGNYEVQVPLLPPLDEDQAQEEDSGNEKESAVCSSQNQEEI